MKVDQSKASDADDASKAPAVFARPDPQRQLCDVLERATSGDDKIAARQLVSGMERPWEQLPARLKSAIRADAASIIAASGGMDEMVSAGYGLRVAEHVLRDLGKRG